MQTYSCTSTSTRNKVIRFSQLLPLLLILSGCYSQKEVSFGRYHNVNAITKIEFRDNSQLFIHNQEKVSQLKNKASSNVAEPSLEITLLKSKFSFENSFTFNIPASEITIIHTDNHYNSSSGMDIFLDILSIWLWL